MVPGVYSRCISVFESTFYKNNFFRNCPEGKIAGKFLKKKAKMYFVGGWFRSKVAVNFVSVLDAYNAPNICPTQRASATAYSTPNRTGQTGQAPPFVQQQHKQRTHGGLRGWFPEHDAHA